MFPRWCVSDKGKPEHSLEVLIHSIEVAIALDISQAYAMTTLLLQVVGYFVCPGLVNCPKRDEDW